MTTLPNDAATKEVTALGARFTETMLYILLDDGREIGVPLERYRWLAGAAPEQRSRWTIEPGGYAIYWEELDDGLEVEHLLSTQTLGFEKREP